MFRSWFERGFGCSHDAGIGGGGVGQYKVQVQRWKEFVRESGVHADCFRTILACACVCVCAFDRMTEHASLILCEDVIPCSYLLNSF